MAGEKSNLDRGEGGGLIWTYTEFKLKMGGLNWKATVDAKRKKWVDGKMEKKIDYGLNTKNC